MENKHLSEDKTKQPNTTKKPCSANWQLYTNGSIGKLKCRVCGVYVTDGGTPICQENKGFGKIFDVVGV